VKAQLLSGGVIDRNPAMLIDLMTNVAFESGRGS
jgi:hypothetical protein